MAQSTKPATSIDVYLEIGKKRVFAGAVDWPGWCRVGRDEEAALQALFDYAPRYAKLLKPAKIAFHAPDDVSALKVVERLDGNTTTDFGAPDIAQKSDQRPIDESELKRQQDLLRAYWKAFDALVHKSIGKDLRKGPRGGGREVEGIAEHVAGAESGYTARLAWKGEKSADDELAAQLKHTHKTALDAFTAAVEHGLPERGPRGGSIWLPRYFVRRVAWHVLDHLWEIEDRLEDAET